MVWGPWPNLKLRKFCSRACANAAKVKPGPRKRQKPTLAARRAHGLLAYYVKVGVLVRPSACEGCGRTDRRIEGAHRDYSKPKEVRWLCRGCHARWDKAEPKHDVRRAVKARDEEEQVEETGGVG